MTLATMSDRSRPLAQRVNAAYLVGIQVADGDENGQDARAELDGLRADVAAADRLARAALAYEDAYIAYSAAFDSRASVDDPRNYAWDAAGDERDAALAAYRARMAQGVSGG